MEESLVELTVAHELVVGNRAIQSGIVWHNLGHECEIHEGLDGEALEVRIHAFDMRSRWLQ